MDQKRWQQIEELLQQALDLDPADRFLFLEKACAGDSELLREVQGLISNEERARTFIETPAAAYVVTPKTQVLPALAIDERISHYRIESLAGIGGMGEVYRAQDEILKRTVALKMLPAEFSSDSSRVRRFEIEAFAASKLNHPNIITIFEITQVKGTPFIAEEFVDGHTLRHLLTDPATNTPRRLSIKQTIDIAIQVVSALNAAHTSWIIHRDIKPENVMVREDGLVKVLDFGIAKLVKEDQSAKAAGPSSSISALREYFGRQSFTMPGAIMGTASYMSPEQAGGEELDGRTDLFSLGVVLFEMVTGKRLFYGPMQAEALNEMARTQEPLPATYRFDTSSKLLEPIIRQLLRYDRHDRYVSASELLNDLEALKHRLESRSSRRVAMVSALVLLLVVSLAAVAALASRSEVWDEQILRDGHTAAVRRAIFSPNGRLLVSVGEDKQVIVWDFARRERLATLTDHADWVLAAAFSPDGKWFATASADWKVIVWDAVKLQKEAVLTGHHDPVTAVAFSPDGRVLVAASSSDRSKNPVTLLWRVGSWEQFGRIPLGAGEVQSLLFPAGNGQMIYTNDPAPPLPDSWDVSHGRPLTNQLEPAWTGHNTAAFSPNSTRFVAVNSLGEVIFVDLKHRRLLTRERAHQDNGRTVAFSPDGRLVATGAENIILWDAFTCQKITTIEYPSIVWNATFSPDGRSLVTTHGDGGIRVWDVRERQHVVGFNEHTGPVRAIAWASAGKRFASAGDDRVVMIWNAESGRREMLLTGHATRVIGLGFTSDGQMLASVDRDGIVIMWDLIQQRERFRLDPHKVSHCLAISPNGRLVATSHGVYETVTGTQLIDIDTRVNRSFHAPSIYGLAFSADGTRLAVAHAQGLPFVWDTATWRVVEQTDLSPRAFISVSFVHDGKKLVTGEDGGIVQLWRTHPLTPTVVIGQHAARVKSVAFSPDGNQVVSAGDDGMIAMWDVNTRKLMTRIGVHTGPVYAVAFAPDGKRLLSGEHDRSVRLYTRHRTLWGLRLD